MIFRSLCAAPLANNFDPCGGFQRAARVPFFPNRTKISATVRFVYSERHGAESEAAANATAEQGRMALAISYQGRIILFRDTRSGPWRHIYNEPGNYAARYTIMIVIKWD